MTNLINQKKERDSNFEILRILAMFFIILFHFNVHGNLDSNEGNIINSFLKDFLSFGMMANYIFIILTGYFMVDSKVNYKKIIKLIIEMCFYSILIFLIFTVINNFHFEWQVAIKSLFPFFWGNWFLIYYILLYLMIPYLNKFINSISKSTFFKLIILLLFIFSLIPTLTNNAWGSTNHELFLLCYFIGAYIKKYYYDQFTKKHTILLIIFNFLLMGIILFISKTVGYNLEIQKLIDDGNYLIVSSFSIFNIIGAVLLVILFKNINIGRNKFINKVSASILGVYLIHDNVMVRNWLWNEFYPNITYYDSYYFILFAFIKVIVVFIVCLLIDQIRICIFSKVENYVANYIYKFFDKIYNNVKKIVALRN